MKLGLFNQKFIELPVPPPKDVSCKAKGRETNPEGKQKEE